MRDGLDMDSVMSRGADNKDTQFSKYLSKVLRHDACKMGLEMRRDGFVRLDDILSHKAFQKFQYTAARVIKIIELDSKQRYSLRTDGDNVLWIRCNQGHSIEWIDNDLLLHRLTDEVPIVVHGTFRRFLPAILQDGLSRMRRNHIHFVADSPLLLSDSGRIKAGVRPNAEVLIFIDAIQSIRENIPFFISDNNVILSPGPIPSQFFIKVLEIQPNGTVQQIIISDQREKA